MHRSVGIGGELARVGLVAFVLAYTWMYADVTVPNERSRLYLAVALVDDHAISIDGPVHRFGPVGDVAIHEGHLYTDKAPGSSLLAAVPYALVRHALPPGSATFFPLLQLVRRTVMIPLALLGFVLARRLLARRGLSSATIDLTTFAWLLGSTAFHYSTAFYGHQIVAVLFLTALVLLEGDDTRRRARGHLAMLGAGLCLGFAGLVEYQAAIGCVTLGLYAAYRALRSTPATLVTFALGVLPSAIAFAAYHHAAFGGPFELSYHHLLSPEVQALHREGVGGVASPRAIALFGILFSLHRGLLVTCPTTLLLVPGLVRMRRRGELALPLVLGVTAFAYLLFAASARAWFAGWSFGPRLLVPMLSLALVPIAEAIDARRDRPFTYGLVLGLVAIGLLYNQAVHAFFPEPPEDARNPLVDVVVTMASEGRVSPNLVERVSPLLGLPSLAPLTVVIAGLFVWLLATSLHGFGVRRRVVALATAFMLTGSAALVPFVVGPTWTEDQRAGFLRVVAIWAYREPPVAP